MKKNQKINTNKTQEKTMKRRKKKFTLKKSIRMTLAALFMITALVVALIPVQNGGVSATSGYEIPSLEELTTGGHGEVSASVPKITNKTMLKYAFPFDGQTEAPNPQNNYFIIDMKGMPSPTNPVPVFEITNITPAKCDLNEYLGGKQSGYNPVPHNVNFEKGVIKNSCTTENPAYKVGDEAVINHEISGTYRLYEETLVTNTAAKEDGTNIQYSYYVVKRKTYRVDVITDEVSGNVVDAKETLIEDADPFYACKESVPNKNDVKYGVNKICDDAFSNNGQIQSVILPNDLGSIGERAFENCTSLTSFEAGSNCYSIGDLAFEGCTALSNVSFDKADNIKFIGDCAFANCKTLKSVVIPKTKCTIGSGAFLSCVSLENVEFHENTPDITLGCNVFSSCSSLSNIACKSVKTIKSHPSASTPFCGIFDNCEDLQTVEFDVAYSSAFPKGTFAGCENLGYVKIYGVDCTFDKNEFDDIKNNGFYIWGYDNYSSNLYKYAADNGITYRSSLPDGQNYDLQKDGYKYVFKVNDAGTFDITEVQQISPAADSTLTIPYTLGGYNLREIGSNAFQGLTNPVVVNIPDSVTAIGDKAFYNMPSLSSVNFVHNRDNKGNDIPAATGTTFGDSVFEKNNNLTEINLRHYDYETGAIYDPNITSLGENAFFTGSKALTITGKMGGSDMSNLYPAYEYAMGEETGRFSALRTGYILYRTGEPECLTARFDPESGEPSLLTYPTKNTVVTVPQFEPDGTISKDPTGNVVTREMTIAELQEAYDPETSTQLEYEILHNFENIIVPAGITSIDNAKGDGMENKYFQNLDGTVNVVLTSVSHLPDEAFASTRQNADDLLNDIVPSTLQNLSVLSDLTSVGQLPFANSKNIDTIMLSPEEGKTKSATNPYYFIENGILYSDDGSKVYLEECIPTTSGQVSPRTDIDEIRTAAFQNCDMINNVNMENCNKLRVIPERCFYDADRLKEVKLPNSCDSIRTWSFTKEKGNNDAKALESVDVYVLDKEVHIDADAFQYASIDSPATLHSYEDSAAERFANDPKHPNVVFAALTSKIKAVFYDYDGTLLSSQDIDAGTRPDEPTPPVRLGYKFIGFSPKVDKILTDTTYIAQYELIPSSSSTTTSSRTTSSSAASSSSSSSSGSSSSGGSSSNNSSSSSSNSSSTSSTGNTMNSASGSASTGIVRPVVVSGAPAPYDLANGTVSNTGDPNQNNGGNNSGNVTTGNTDVYSTAKGINNSGKMSATVNGSSDNYVIKITETAEADTAAQTALTAAFGSLDNIRYVPFDISLYDSTGTSKISPVPEGVTVSITMPIPDNLSIYGGNAKVASTVNGMLEGIQPRFTVIDGVPCMNYTVTHLSPYVVYVDTANLTEAGISDATPKTADPIHPKWFLAIGLACLSVVLFLKRDKDMTKGVAA